MKPQAEKSAGWTRMLEAVPVRNEAVEVRQADDGTLRITVKKKKPGWLVPPLSWIFKPKTSKTVALDRLGAEVRGLCDGVTNVESIIELFADRYGLTFHESRVSVTEYLGSLVKFGVIAVRARP